jgi:predicted nucleic acid-binding Zn ribbon protein
MSFHDLNLILKNITNQTGWETQKQYLHILNLWQKLVSPQISQHSRPSHLTQQVLWIAVSSSVWSQHLSLQRYSLLKKLNAHLDLTLSDLRFSPALWYQNSAHLPADQAHLKPTSHPSQVVRNTPVSPDFPQGDTPLSAFHYWQHCLQVRSQEFPLCPLCAIPTPQGELDRWHKCFICFTKSKSDPDHQF